MSEYLLYIAKSTICLSVLFGLYYFLLRKETFFTLNRRILIFTVLFAVFTPLFYTPECLKSTINLSIIPDEPSLVVSELIENASVDESIIKEENNALNNLSLNKLGTAEKTVNETHLTGKKVRSFQISYIQILTFIYFLGFIISVICSFIGIIKTLNIIRKAKKIKYKSYYLSVLATDVSSFSFGRYIILSKHDFDNNKEEILTHEEAHVGLRHSLDLLFVECFKSIYWFNPVIYMVIKNLKEIHEYQADQFTLNKGVDARQYQLLIIKKSVGYEQFALANSFHHCQIKKRIVMINKKESKRIWKWKAAAFLPVACVLLMSFSNKLEKTEIKKTLDIKELTVKKNKVNHWTEADFMDASINKKAYLETPYTVSVLVDQDYGIIVQRDEWRKKRITKSQTVYHTEKYDDDFFIDNLENYERVIKKAVIFKNSPYPIRKQFKQIVVNGKKEMVSNYKIVISRGEYVSDSEYQKAFDLVGRTIESVKNNFSKERYSREYRELVRDEKNTIDKLVPIKVFYLNDRNKKPFTKIEKLFKFNTSNYSKIRVYMEYSG
ncbi:MAG: M56 family metallopeptidase [Marinifilaceae bacterium]